MISQKRSQFAPFVVLVLSILLSPVLNFRAASALALQAEKTSTLTLAISSNPQGLFPLTSSDTTSSNVQDKLFESLIQRDIETFEWKPLIAKTWKISDDGKEFSFTLDDKARFWDGSPITPQDVKFSFDVIFYEGVDTAPLKPYYQAIEKVEIKDAKTVVFKTRDLYYKNFDVAAGLTILKKDFYEKLYQKDKSLAKAETTRQAMGSGPWQVEKWDENRQIVLKRNENYWAKEAEIKEGTWTYNRIVFNIIQDLSVQLESLKRGDISYLAPTSKQFALEMNAPPFGTQIVKVKGTNKSPVGYRYIGWNLKNPLFADVNVRWAMSHLVNWPLWVKKFEYDLQEPAIGPYSPKSDQHDPSLKPVEFSTKLARERLAKAGWTQAGPDGFLVKDGRKFQFTIMFPTQAKDVYEPILSEYKNQAKKVGVDVQLRGLEWTSFTKLLDERNFEAVVLGWSRAVDGDLKQIFHSDSMKEQGSNFVSYSNPELDKLIEKHRTTMNYQERTKLAHQMQNIIFQDQPYTFLTEPKYVLYANQSNIKKVKDVYNYGIGTAYWRMPE